MNNITQKKSVLPEGSDGKMTHYSKPKTGELNIVTRCKESQL